jgi:hypothetical protein
MFSLVYVSRSNQNFKEDQLLELLRTFRENNLRLQITGLLLYKDGNFMQLLEGAKDVVNGLYEKISRDIRHVNVNTLIDETVETRLFPEWSMGFQSLNKMNPVEVPGYSDFLHDDLTGDQFVRDPSRALSLLTLFKKI